MRRGVGIQRRQNAAKSAQAFKAKGESLNEEVLGLISVEMDKFKEKIEQFVKDPQHLKVLERNPEQRGKFYVLCTKLGVDGLSTTKKRYPWSSILSQNTKYYTELSVKVIQLCFETKPLNGGVLDLATVTRRLQVTQSDVEAALRTLEPLGKGIYLERTNNVLVSVGKEISPDSMSIINYVKQNDILSLCFSDLHAIGLSGHRSELALRGLLDTGVVWKDTQSSPESHHFVFQYF